VNNGEHIKRRNRTALELTALTVTGTRGRASATGLPGPFQLDNTRGAAKAEAILRLNPQALSAANTNQEGWPQ
jgi:hypothetical protein